MKSARVTRLLSGKGLPKFEHRLAVNVPAQIYEWKASLATRAQALDVQAGNREQLTRAFADALCVLGYERDEKGNGRFLLGHWDEAWGY